MEANLFDGDTTGDNRIPYEILSLPAAEVVFKNIVNQLHAHNHQLEWVECIIKTNTFAVLTIYLSDVKKNIIEIFCRVHSTRNNEERSGLVIICSDTKWTPSQDSPKNQPLSLYFISEQITSETFPHCFLVTVVKSSGMIEQYIRFYNDRSIIFFLDQT